MDDLIKKFQKLMPNKIINDEPKTSTEQLLNFEKEFKINTNDVVNETKDISYIPNEIIDKWKLYYRIFIIMKGSLSEINQIK